MKQLTKKVKIILICSLTAIVAATSVLVVCFSVLHLDDNGDFYIYNLGIDIGPYESGEFRADTFSEDNSHFDDFYGFGQYLQPNKMNSCFEWRLDISARVYAPCDAKIVGVNYQALTSDWEITLAPKSIKGSYLEKKGGIQFDHVIIDTALIKEGMTVTVGQILGTVAPYDPVHSPNVGRVELDINAKEVHYAPMLFVHPSVKDKLSAKINSLVALFPHDTDPGAEMFAAGCWESGFGNGTWIPESYYN